MDDVHRTSPEDEMLEVQLHHSTPILGAGAVPTDEHSDGTMGEC
jgi:hypothetical protein